MRARRYKTYAIDGPAMKVEGTYQYQQSARRSRATLVETEPAAKFDPERRRLKVDRPLPVRQRILQKRSENT